MLPLFSWLAEAGEVALDDQYRAFNMGVGLVIAVAEAEVARAESLLASVGETPHRIGRIIAGTPGVVYA